MGLKAIYIQKTEGKYPKNNKRDTKIIKRIGTYTYHL